MDFKKRLNEIKQRANEAKSRDDIWSVWFDLVRLGLLLSRVEPDDRLAWGKLSEIHFKKVKSYV